MQVGFRAGHLHARIRGVVRRIGGYQRKFFHSHTIPEVRKRRARGASRKIDGRGGGQHAVGAKCSKQDRTGRGAGQLDSRGAAGGSCHNAGRWGQRQRHCVFQGGVRESAILRIPRKRLLKFAAIGFHLGQSCVRGLGPFGNNQYESEAEAALRDGCIGRAPSRRLNHVFDGHIQPLAVETDAVLRRTPRIDTAVEHHERRRHFLWRAEAHQVLIQRRVALHRGDALKTRRNARPRIRDAIAFKQRRLRIKRKCPVHQRPTQHRLVAEIGRIANAGQR